MTTHADTLTSFAKPLPLPLLTTLAIWFAVVLGMALAGLFDAPAGQVPVAIVLALLLPLVGFAALYQLMPRARHWIQTVDIRPLILIHAFRTVGVAFLLLASFEQLPWVFAIPAGVGDAIAAFGALVLGVALYSNQAVSRAAINRWNRFGVADFVLAVSLGILTRSGQPLNIEPVTSDAMGAFPLVLIPTFVVPVLLLSHIIVAMRIRWDCEP